MYFAGLDVHGKQHWAYLMDAQGERVWEGAVPTTPQGFSGLIRRLKRYGVSKVRVGVDASGPHWVRVMDRLCQARRAAFLVNGNDVKRWGQSGAYRTRTDRVDASIVADDVRVRERDLCPYRPAPAAHKALLDLSKIHDR